MDSEFGEGADAPGRFGHIAMRPDRIRACDDLEMRITPRIEGGAQSAATRLFPRFSEADDNRWPQVIARVKSGSAVDALIAASGKCLEGVPGMGFVFVRQDVMAGCEGNSHSLAMDLQDQHQYMERTGQWRFTPPTHVVAALAEATSPAPTQQVPLIRVAESAARIDAARWGLLPTWKKDETGAPLFNARGETVAEKPSFRSAFKARRGLMVLDGYYEWRPLPDGATRSAEAGGSAPSRRRAGTAARRPACTSAPAAGGTTSTRSPSSRAGRSSCCRCRPDRTAGAREGGQYWMLPSPDGYGQARQPPRRSVCWSITGARPDRQCSWPRPSP